MSNLLVSSADFLSTATGYILPFLFVLMIVIFVHEMGHFLAGRACGVHVEKFSLGFGPRIASFYDKQGTEWALSAIPLGGYVKFKGDLNSASIPDEAALTGASEEERTQSFPHKALWQRAFIVAAGPIANFVLAFVIFLMSFTLIGRHVVEPVISAVVSGSVAEQVGFKPGDRILKINEDPISTFDDVSRRVSISEGEMLTFVIEREAKELTLSALARIQINKSVLGTERRPIMGFIGSNNPQHVFVKQYTLSEASAASFNEVGFVADRTVNFIGGLFSGREKVDQLSGPTRIAYISGKVAESGIGSLLILIAIISISVGLMNLVPVPMLDGGHLLFYAIEAIFGRPISPRIQEIGFRLGFTMVFGLMLFSTWNDIAALTGISF